MATSEIEKAVEQICAEKNISKESVIETIEAALAVAYRKDFGEKNQNIKVEFDLESAGARVFDVKEVVEDPPPEEELEDEEEEKDKKFEKKEGKEKTADEKEKKEDSKKGDKELGKSKKEDLSSEAPSEGEEAEEEEEEKKFNPKTQIGITEAKKIKKTAKIGDVIKTELFPPDAYGRMAAQTAKQVIIQKLREAEREMIFRDFKDKEGEILNGAVQRVEGRVVLVDMGNTTGVMPPQEQVNGEDYMPGARLKVYIVSVEKTTKGPEILVSRSHPEMVKKLFTLEVPEIASGTIEIKAVAREAGSRSKISVQSKDPNIDPVGSCVGQRGSRVQTVIAELGGEKIDIIEHDDDPVKYIINSLSPAKIISVTLNEKEKLATAEVKEDQLSLAIGKAGQNVRLSAKLTGWRIDVVKEGEVGKKEKVIAKPDDEDKAEEKKEDSEKDPAEEKQSQEQPEEEEKIEKKPEKEKTEKPAEKKSKPKKEESSKGGSTAGAKESKGAEKTKEKADEKSGEEDNKTKKDQE